MGWNCPECGIDNEMSQMVCKCGYKASIESDLSEIAKKGEVDKKAELRDGIDRPDVLKGRIIESKKKEIYLIFKVILSLGCIFFFLFTFFIYPIALGLCLTIIGIIIGIPMFIGAFILQGALLWCIIYIFLDGNYYKIECPVCQSIIPNLFKPRIRKELSTQCPSCKKNLIVRGEEILHFR